MSMAGFVVFSLGLAAIDALICAHAHAEGQVALAWFSGLCALSIAGFTVGVLIRERM